MLRGDLECYHCVGVSHQMMISNKDDVLMFWFWGRQSNIMSNLTSHREKINQSDFYSLKNLRWRPPNHPRVRYLTHIQEVSPKKFTSKYYFSKGQPQKSIKVTSNRKLSSSNSKLKRLGTKVTGNRYVGGLIRSSALRSDW